MHAVMTALGMTATVLGALIAQTYLASGEVRRWRRR